MKKMLKKLIVLCLCMSLCACSNHAKQEDALVSTATTENLTAEKEALSIIDQAGRVVEFDDIAQTAASGYYIVTTTLIGLGCADNLVGIEMKADSRKIYSAAAPEIIELPSLGNKKNFNLEECVAADPDVVFLPVSLQDYVEQLEEMDMKVILLSPETSQSFDEAVEIIAMIMGKEDIAKQYFAYRDDLIKKYIKEVDEKKKVYFAGSDILEAAGGSMFQNELIKQAQGEYVFQESLKDIGNWQTINIEEIIAADPEYIFIEQDGINIEDILNDPSLSEVTAVKEGNVYVFPSEYETWDTPNLSSCLGILWMYATLYPERLSLEDVATEANAFYQQFYGFDAQIVLE